MVPAPESEEPMPRCGYDSPMAIPSFWATWKYEPSMLFVMKVNGHFCLARIYVYKVQKILQTHISDATSMYI